MGFTMVAWDTATFGKWVNITTTYSGASSTYIIYMNAVPVLNYSAWSPATSVVLYQDNTTGSSYNTMPIGPLSWTGDAPKQIVIGTWPAGLYGVSPTLGSNGCFNGAIDELRIYNTVLTQQDVSDLYQDGLNGK